MTSPTWDRLQDLFSRATDLPPQEREAFVTKEAGDNIALRTEVLELLACDHGAGTGPLTNALGAAIDNTTRDRRRAAIGQIVSNYKLVSVLGHGGTGTVYLAERADRQYSAQVAVKIIDTPALHGELGQRFRAERQILASLNHPNIARLIDAGETDLGQPYLIMEYVHGEPLDRYCDRQGLDLRARLNLFLEICSAVQYAHQNLIVHRDLKPANILVAADGTPKLLDFGIAKLLDAGDAASVLALTRMNDRLLTPEYASPEQILGRPVTTTSDVYALGVVLYELLTGLRPYAVPSSASQLELERTICISDPSRPSAAVRKAAVGSAESSAQIGTIAANRGLSVEKLERRLQGDIDAIVMRALRKEPQHRYGSAEQLADDIRRYLAKEPVHARQGNWAYYSNRFIRRHAFGVSAGLTFAVFLAAFAIAMSVQTQRIAAERDRAEVEGERAERVSEFMLNVFSASDPFVSQGKEFSARDLLDQAARTIRNDLNQHPEVRARLMEGIGRAYRRQNEFQMSVSLLKEASRLREGLPDEDGTKQTSVLAELAFAHYQAGNFEEADRTLRKALEIAERSSNAHTPAYAKLLGDLGRVKHQTGDIATARVYLEKSLQLSQEILSPADTAIADVLLTLSSIHMWESDLDAAEKRARESLAIYTQSVPEQYPDRVLAQSVLADVLIAKDDLAGAEALLQRSLAAQRILYGEASSQVAATYDSLAQVRRAQGRWTDAEEYARRAIASQTDALGNDHFMTGYFHSSLAVLLFKQGRYSAAEQEVRHSLDIYARTLPPDHQYVAASEHFLGEIMLTTNRLKDAETLLSAAMHRWERTSPASSRAARSASALGEALYRMGRFNDAEKYLVEGYVGLARDNAAAAEDRTKARERITRFYIDRGQRDKLEALMLATNEPDATPPQARRTAP